MTVLAALTVLVALLTAPAARAAEPFYARLFDDGSAAYARGDYAEAIESLRIACFGMLDEPDALAGCLVQLALAQAGAEDEAAFGETFARLLEIERRFSAYSHLQLTAEQRRSFEGALERWVPYETLRLTPAFADVAGRKLAAEIADKKPAERQGPGVKRPARDLRRERQSPPPPAVGEVAAQDAAAAPDPVPEDPIPEDPIPEDPVPEDPAPEVVAPIARAAPPPGVKRLLEEGQALLRAGAGRDELAAMFARVQTAADEYPEQVELQTLAAEVAYRLTRWRDAVTYFRRSGPDGPRQPVQQFYLSVALYETGEFAAAAEMLERCLPLLQQTDFVRGYTAKIRSAS